MLDATGTHRQASASQLSAAARSVWAKTNLHDPADQTSYLQLWQHLSDSAEVAQLLWQRFIPPYVRDHIAATLGLTTDQAESLYVFLAGCHDAGKASPAFIIQNPHLAENSAECGLPVAREYQGNPMRSAVRHELVGEISLHTWLTTQAGVPRDASGVIAAVLGGHHGTGTTDQKVQLYHEQPALVGGSEWDAVRNELFTWMAELTGARSTFNALSETRALDPTEAKTAVVLLTASVILADWIASNDSLFPLNQSAADELVHDAETRARKAFSRLHLPAPWHAQAIAETLDERFAARFRIPGAKARPIQRAAVEAAEQLETPGLIIIEATTGEGKTEAALLAAETLAERFGLNGVSFALPTQATTNAMFTRLHDWVRSLPATEGHNVVSLGLVHGKSDLNAEFAALPGNERSTTFPESTLRSHAGETVTIANWWLQGRRRATLATFVASTFDQLLMAGLRSKHVVLRHLSFAGKVVILDEVHAIDTFTNEFLETTLQWLAAEGVPVILLSATLPVERRRALLDAYASARRQPRPAAPPQSIDDLFPVLDAEVVSAEAEQAAPVTHPAATGDADLAYPLISTVDANGTVHTHHPESSGRFIDITIDAIPDDDAALIDTIRSSTPHGGSVAVIRNTVGRAQHAYRLLTEAFPEAEVRLAHSRFLAFDRARIDAELVEGFGPHSTGDGLRIVVGTQVIEQSLDVDFDLMLTDLAPIDLVLQRAGRLHRHRRTRPAGLEQARLLITGVDWAPEVPKPDRGSQRIYGAHLLLRTLAALQVSPGHSHAARIPDAVPSLIQQVYGDEQIGSDGWQSEMREAAEQWQRKNRDRASAAHNFRLAPPQDPSIQPSLRNWLEAASADPDAPQGRGNRAGVRDGDDSFEVLVLTKTNGQLTLPAWGAWSQAEARPLPQYNIAPDLAQARAIRTSTISIGSAATGVYDDLDGLISALEQHTAAEIPAEWDGQAMLRGELYLVFDEDGRCQLSLPAKGGAPRTLILTYDQTTGLEHS